MVYFVGAGAGDPELLTLKGKRLIDHADTLIYAGSLVNPEVLAGRKPSSKVYDSAGMTLEEVLAVMKETEQAGGTTVRVHTGDASIYGAIREQLDALDKLGIAHEVVPGVSFFSGGCGCHAERIHPAGSDTDCDTDTDGRQNACAGTGTYRRVGKASCNHGDLPLCGTDCGAGRTAENRLSGDNAGGCGL